MHVVTDKAIEGITQSTTQALYLPKILCDLYLDLLFGLQKTHENAMCKYM